MSKMIKKQKKDNFVCHLMTLCTLLWGMPPPRSDILGETTYIKTPQTTFNASIWWKRLVATYIDAELNFLADFHTEFGAVFTDFGRIFTLTLAYFHTEFGAIFQLNLAPFFHLDWRQNPKSILRFGATKMPTWWWNRCCCWPAPRGWAAGSFPAAAGGSLQINKTCFDPKSTSLYKRKKPMQRIIENAPRVISIWRFSAFSWVKLGKGGMLHGLGMLL